MREVISIALMMTLSCAFAQTLDHGKVKRTSDSPWQVWDSGISEWTTIDLFWSRYAEGKGGLTWGPSETYPNYNEVKEFDTLLIELPQGQCLMEFFHTRWRRANDVRRWDEAFNDYGGGCPYVFD